MRLRIGNKRAWFTLMGIGAVLWLGAAFVLSSLPDPPEVSDDPSLPVGYRTVDAIEQVMEAQLAGLAGWTPNDLPIAPTYITDNRSSFQLGVLQVVRHASRVLRDNFTRQRTSDAVHPDTDTAWAAYSNEARRWMFPSAEGAFGRGNAALRRFKDALGDSAHFYPRADNLVQLLEPLASELGAVTTLLLESRRDQTSWFEIDDNFYRARGVGHATHVVLRAVGEDFRSVLRDKNAEEITDLILDSLGESQFAPWIVTNGDRDGILANHSANLKAFLDDARQKMNSLITILRQG